jgi:endonuclease-3
MSFTAGQREQRVQTILEILKDEFPDRSSPLEHRNAFELLIGVILSAQTTDAQVNRITPTLFAEYPTATALADADPSRLEEILHPVGFFRAKTRSIRGCAQALCRDHGGEVPRSMNELVSLPGVGRKSANVIRSHVFGEPAIVVDTHFGRVVRRLDFTSASKPDMVEEELAGIVPASDQSDFSMVINFHGRKTCTAKKPQCEGCSIRAYCPFPESKET